MRADTTGASNGAATVDVLFLTFLIFSTSSSAAWRLLLCSSARALRVEICFAASETCSMPIAQYCGGRQQYLWRLRKSNLRARHKAAYRRRLSQSALWYEKLAFLGVFLPFLDLGVTPPMPCTGPTLLRPFEFLHAPGERQLCLPLPRLKIVPLGALASLLPRLRLPERNSVEVGVLISQGSVKEGIDVCNGGVVTTCSVDVATR